jgi:hypothetical protein
MPKQQHVNNEFSPPKSACRRLVVVIADRCLQHSSKITNKPNSIKPAIRKRLTVTPNHAMYHTVATQMTIGNAAARKPSGCRVLKLSR